MATNTTNLHLIKPAGSERVQISQINQNMDILDEKIGAVGNTSVQSQVNSLKNQVATTQITNEYSTVLSVINAIAANKTLPFTIQKSGNSAYTDLPSGLTNTCEWNVICIGSSMRITAVLTVYTGGSSRNGFSYTANIYNGSYIFTWQTIDPRRNNLTSIASDTTILGLEPGAYQINLSAASNYIPDRYGTLVIDKSAVTYGVATFVATSGIVYTRHMNGANAWHGAWVGGYPLQAKGGYSSETTIEAFLETLPNNSMWMTTITTNDSNGELVTKSGQHLFYIVQFAVGNNKQRFQIAVALNGKMYVRPFMWWSTWLAWTALN